MTVFDQLTYFDSEYVHDFTHNSHSIHTGKGCSMSRKGFTSAFMLKQPDANNCAVHETDNQGCVSYSRGIDPDYAKNLYRAYATSMLALRARPSTKLEEECMQHNGHLQLSVCGSSHATRSQRTSKPRTPIPLGGEHPELDSLVSMLVNVSRIRVWSSTRCCAGLGLTVYGIQVSLATDTRRGLSLMLDPLSKHCCWSEELCCSSNRLQEVLRLCAEQWAKLQVSNLSSLQASLILCHREAYWTINSLQIVSYMYAFQISDSSSSAVPMIWKGPFVLSICRSDHAIYHSNVASCSILYFKCHCPFSETLSLPIGSVSCF